MVPMKAAVAMELIPRLSPALAASRLRPSVAQLEPHFAGPRESLVQLAVPQSRLTHPELKPCSALARSRRSLFAPDIRQWPVASPDATYAILQSSCRRNGILRARL